MEPAALIALVVAGSALFPLLAAVPRPAGVTGLIARWTWAKVRIPVAVFLLGAVLGRAPAGAATPLPGERLRTTPPAAAGESPRSGPAPQEPAASGRVYMVRSGDSLWAIAARSLRERGREATNDAVDRYWRLIYAANLEVVGADPDLIFPGQSLQLPEEMP